MSDLDQVLSRLAELGRTRRESRGKLSTGNDALNHLLSGGLERGRLTQLYGPSGSGKSVTVGQIAGYVGECGLGTVAFVDADHSIENAVAFYGPLSDLQDSVLVYEPTGPSEALEVSRALIGAADLVVVDSLGAFEPNTLSAGQICCELAEAADRSGAVVLVTNQVRADIRRRREVAYGGQRPWVHSAAVIRLSASPLRSKGVRVGVQITADLEKPQGTQKRVAWDLEFIK